MAHDLAGALVIKILLASEAFKKLWNLLPNTHLAQRSDPLSFDLTYFSLCPLKGFGASTLTLAKAGQTNSLCVAGIIHWRTSVFQRTQ